MSFLDEVMKQKTLPSMPNFDWNEPIRSNSTRGDIGLELEMEGNLYQGADLNKLVVKSGSSWTVHNDGSLRNGGLEYVLNGPCRIDETEELLDFLFKTLKEKGTRIQHSNRTSTHIHVNVGGMKVSELTSFICYWGLFEQAVINWCGTERKRNQFCLSNRDTGGWLSSQWLNAVQTGRFRWDNTYKYSALNLGSFQNFGSFEFRCMAGAGETGPVLALARFLHALREDSKKTLPDRLAIMTSEETPSGMLRRLRDEYSLELADILLQQEDFDREAMTNFRDYQVLSFVYPWTELKGEIAKTCIENPFTKKKVNKVSLRTRDEPVPIEEIFANRGGNVPNEFTRIRPLEEMRRELEDIVGLEPAPAPVAAPAPELLPDNRITEGDQTFQRVRRIRNDAEFNRQLASFMRAYGVPIQNVRARNGFFYLLEG